MTDEARPPLHLLWHKRFPKEMLHESMAMDLRAYGAYCVVLDLIYFYGGAVRDDEHLISRYMGGTNGRGWKPLRGRLLKSGHLYIDGDTLRSPRADAELTKMKRTRDANAMGGHITQALRRVPSRGPSYGSSSPYHRSNLKTKAAEKNDLAKVHLKYTRSQKPEREREEENGASHALDGRGAFPDKSTNDQTAQQAERPEKGLTGREQASRAGLKPLAVSPEFLQSEKRKWKH